MNREKLEELFGIDLRSLAAFRIVLAFILLLDLTFRFPWIEAHYTDAGVLPLAVLYKNYWVTTNWSLHALSPDAPLQYQLFAVQAVFVVCMLIGWNTRIAIMGVWVLLTSLQTRNQLVLQGGDDMLRMLVFWSIFLPMDARWSMDSRGQAAPRARTFSIATVALMLQIFYIYWATAYLKWAPVWWPDGLAVEMALRLDSYTTWPGKLLLASPFTRPLTYFTLFWEYVGPLVAIFPWKRGPVRTFAVFVFFIMHLGFGATLEIGLFWMTSCAAWLPFLPSWFWDNLPRKFPSMRTLRGVGTIRAESPVLSVAILASLIYVTLWNARTLDGKANYKNMLQVFPTLVNPIGYAFRFDQYWQMFAPSPPTRDGWYVIPGTLDDGTEVDLYSWRSEVSYDKPRHMSTTYEGQRWRKFLANLPDQRHSVLRPGYANWVKSRWERRHPDMPRVRELEIVFMLEISHPQSEETPRKTSLGKFSFP